MSYWNEGGFFKNLKAHVIKWWRIVLLPVFRINNNENTNLNTTMDATNMDSNAKATMDVVNVDMNSNEAISTNLNENVSSLSLTNHDANQILRQIEHDKLDVEKQKMLEIENLKRKQLEEERIVAILNSNKVKVDNFIQEAKDKREISNNSAEELKKQENLRRAQEIIDRLNREAAEDEAKKLEEIEKAKQLAKEKF